MTRQKTCNTVLPPEIVMHDAFNVILWTSADIYVVHDDLGWKNRTRYNRFWRAGCSRLEYVDIRSVYINRNKIQTLDISPSTMSKQNIGNRTPLSDGQKQWLKWFCEAGGAHLTKPGWNKPHTHSYPTNLALFRHKITLYRFNQGGSYYCRGAQMGAGGSAP